MNIEVLSKIIWIPFSLLIAEEKHGGCSSFSFDAQRGYYTEHQRNNERCFPYFPLTAFGWAIVSLVFVWKRSCSFAFASFPKRKQKEGKETEEEEEEAAQRERREVKSFAADSLLMNRLVTGRELWRTSVGTNYVQKFPKNCQCQIAVGSSFQTQIILSYLLLQRCTGCSCDSAALRSAGAGNKAVPKATIAAPRSFARGRKSFAAWQESRGACVPLQGGMTERENQQQKGMGLLWLRIALSYAEGHSGTNSVKVTSPISGKSFGCPFSYKRRPRLLK